MKNLISIEPYTLVNEGVASVSKYLPDHILITDQKLFDLYGKAFDYKQVILVPEGEQAKSLKVAESCWQQMYDKEVDRQSCVVALGGGSVTDLAGFVASCYMRGIDLIHIPTTLLGMVDAAIGGKTALNLNGGKNIIGAFYLPKHVYIITEFLNTLPEREYNSAFGEVIKYGVVKDRELFFKIASESLPWIIERCCQIKMSIINQDIYDQGVRNILNYGHTFAHALEILTDHKQLLHGEAVAIGMSCAIRVAEKIGVLEDISLIEAQDTLLKKFRLPTELPKNVLKESLISLMTKDKKAKNGRINLILPKEIGTVDIYNIESKDLEKLL